MRTVTPKSVYDAVVRLHGGNPRLQRDEDLASTLMMHINSRVEQAVQAWDWPEWSVTEERAFRQTWFDTVQYLRVNDLSVPDEMFYLPTMTYYQVNPDAAIDPPVGTLPTDSTTDPTYFLQLTTVDPYIEYDQPFKRPIGQPLGIYSVNPVTVGCCRGPWMLRFHPSDKGIAVCCASGPTVFILYQLTVPTYSMQMHIPGGPPHLPGDVVLDETTNECFQAITTTSDSPSTLPSAWTRVPFLSKWYDFVRWGAFADSLSERDQGGSFDPNMTQALIAKAEQNANDAFQAQVDSLTMQGQTLRWDFHRHRYWCESIPWTGGTVTTLADVIPPGFTKEPPVPPGFRKSPPSPTDEYHPEIVSLSAASPALNQLPTITMLVNSLVTIIIIPQVSAPGTPPEKQEWRLESGAAQVGNPGELNPLDYNPTTNPKHWRQIA